MNHSSIGTMTDEQLMVHLLGRGATEEEVVEVCGRLTNALDEVDFLAKEITRWRQLLLKEKSRQP